MTWNDLRLVPLVLGVLVACYALFLTYGAKTGSAE
jgi:hypothetical protein